MWKSVVDIYDNHGRKDIGRMIRASFIRHQLREKRKTNEDKKDHRDNGKNNHSNVNTDFWAKDAKLGKASKFNATDLMNETETVNHSSSSSILPILPFNWCMFKFLLNYL